MGTYLTEIGRKLVQGPRIMLPLAPAQASTAGQAVLKQLRARLAQESGLQAGGPGSGRKPGYGTWKVINYVVHPKHGLQVDKAPEGEPGVRKDKQWIERDHEAPRMHVDWFKHVGLPTSGDAFDKIHRGYVQVDHKGKEVSVRSYSGYERHSGTEFDREHPEALKQEIHKLVPETKNYKWTDAVTDEKLGPKLDRSKGQWKALAIQAYSPDQPRDADGRFGSGNGAPHQDQDKTQSVAKPAMAEPKVPKGGGVKFRQALVESELKTRGWVSGGIQKLHTPSGTLVKRQVYIHPATGAKIAIGTNNLHYFGKDGTHAKQSFAAGLASANVSKLLDKVGRAPAAVVAPAPAAHLDKGPSTVASSEHLLATTPVIGVKNLGGGVSVTRVITLADGTKAIFKPASGEPEGRMRQHIRPGQATEREVGSWEVAKLVGMADLHPPVVQREVNGERGAVMGFRLGDVAANAEDGKKFDGDRNLARAAVFDYVIQNTDRHGKNWLIDGDNMHLIDHGLAFPERTSTARNNKLVEEIAKRERAVLWGGAKVPPPISDFVTPFIKAKADIVKALTSLKLPSGSISRVALRIERLKTMTSWQQLEN